MRITRREKKFWEQHLSCVRHITLDPKGPGVVRLHMIPPRAEGKDEPFLLLLNGAKLIPLNLSWAILLANFMAALESFFTEGDNAPDREVEQADWERLAEEAVTATRSVYPRTKPEQLREDLALLMESLIAIARGQEPPVEVGTLSLGDYAPYMSAPHRMDLMVSAMTQDGAWHCNQKCLHCHAAGQPMGESRELTTAQWKEALERLRHANIPQVTFTGGEPTLRADLVELVEAGNITNQKKTLHRGKSVATFLMGTRRLYDYVDNNPAVAMYPVQYVNDPYVIARNDNVVSVNASLQIDLTGQVCAESIGPYQHSGTGGATDFAWGAYHSKGGRAILAQTSTTKKGTLSRIVPILDPGAIVSVSRNLTDMVVTEYGVAKLRQRTVGQRVENLIAVAHPDFRAELRKQAAKYMYY